MNFISEKQKILFLALEKYDELIFGCGPKGAVVNLVGKFKVNKNHHGEDQLDVDDGTNHAHIDWKRVKKSVIGDYHGEGMISFFDENDCLFRFYNPAGPFPVEVSQLCGDLI